MNVLTIEAEVARIFADANKATDADIAEARLEVQIAEREIEVCALRYALDSLRLSNGDSVFDPTFWKRRAAEHGKTADYHRKNLHAWTGSPNAPRAETGE